ncbi:MAG: DUF2752 domain-containing protein [Acidobacteria bacterium]|nr:DUF2752 domain-containing protein [Acidobacteriota bacterium]
MITLGIPALLLTLMFWDVPTAPAVTICGFRNLTGLSCPGCGITRGLSALLHGELLEAVRFNPLAIPASLFSILVWLRSLCVLTNQTSTLNWIDRLLAWRHHRRLMWALLAILAAFWLWRVGVYLQARGFQAAVQEGWLYRLFHQASA